MKRIHQAFKIVKFVQNLGWMSNNDTLYIDNTYGVETVKV